MSGSAGGTSKYINIQIRNYQKGTMTNINNNNEEEALLSRFEFIVGQIEKSARINREFLLAQIAILEAKMMGHWTLDNQRERDIAQQFTAAREAVQVAMESQNKAAAISIVVAKETVENLRLSYDKRFEGVNEFRQALSDQTNTFIPRLEFSTSHQSLEDKVDTLASRLDKIEANKVGSEEKRTHINDLVPWIIAILSFIALCFSVGITIVK